MRQTRRDASDPQDLWTLLFPRQIPTQLGHSVGSLRGAGTNHTIFSG